MKNARQALGQILSATLAGTALLFLAGTSYGATTTYTTDVDFDRGALSGVNHTAVHDQLQLDVIGTTFPRLWIANAGEDTVSKFDTVNNKEVARYRTWFGPAGQPGYVDHRGDAYFGAAPSRTAVDLEGNAYVLNRHFDGLYNGLNRRSARLFKILAEGGIDRNGNGVIDTSFDTNNDGAIAPSEMKNLADINGDNALDAAELQDERIAWSVPVGAPGGLGRALCIGTDGHLWIGLYNHRQYYKVSAVDGSILAGPISTAPSAGQPNAGAWTPYGCLIDKNGVLWSASLSGLLGKISNTASNVGPYAVASFADFGNYGIALGNNKIYLGSGNRQFDPVSNTFAGILNMDVGTLGLVVDGAGNIIGGYDTIRKVSPAGALLWQAPLQSGGSFAIGIQVDSNNDVWQVGFSSHRLQKYRGSDGAPLGTFAVGNSPYTYSDAAGFSARNVTNSSGTWTLIHDGGNAGTPWGRVSWTETVPLGASISVRVRAADNQDNLPLQSYVAVSNGTDFSGVTGRFIQIETRLNANLENLSPQLFDLTVASTRVNVPPLVEISSPVDGQLFALSSNPVPLTANILDENDTDTHTCAISWGDGSGASVGTVVESSGAGTCTGSKTLSVGVYNSLVTVSDGEASASDTVMFVVYDPTGGFVTGGGWIQSPAGAFAANLALEGKANFGFVSKYQKGATRPSGETEFQFHVGNLNFHSSNYEWLVVSGARAQYKGSGTINGAGDYGFLLTATDGQVTGGGGVDKFRIKIWSKDTGATVYDNQMGDSDDAATTQSIVGGSIVIHSPKK